MEQQGVDATMIAPSAATGLASSTGLLDASLDRRGRCFEGARLDHAGWRRDLREAIVQRVLPRLSSAGDASPRLGGRSAFPPQVVEAFARSTLSTDAGALILAVEDFRADGASLEAVFLDLLAPAARHLGDLWLADRLSFFDVTIGLGRLQAVVRALGPNFEGRIGGGGERGYKILLAPVPGEQHVFGLSIVAAFFRRAGWIVVFEPAGLTADVLARVGTEAFDAVGLSAAGDGALSRVPELADAIRKAAGRRHVQVLAGGPAFLADPEAARAMPVDAIACDATEAVRIAAAFQRRAAAA